MLLFQCTLGGPLSFISYSCLIFRARPLNPFEKDRGDKNIIKLPGDGAVWVSCLYCFVKYMANVFLALARGISIIRLTVYQYMYNNWIIG